MRDLASLQRERQIVIKVCDKTGGFAIMPFEGYDKSVREKLAEKYRTEDGVDRHKYPETTKKELKAQHKAVSLQEGICWGEGRRCSNAPGADPSSPLL